MVLIFTYISITYFFIAKIANLDFDPYHDGFIFPPALVVAEGGMPNRDAFSPYGPLSPLIQGKWLFLFGKDVISLRMHGVFLLLVVFTMLFVLLCGYLDFYLALLIATLWILSNPLIVQPTLPWPDLYVCILQLFVLILAKNQRTQKSSWLFILIGFISGLSIFIKINFILSFFLAIILMFIFKTSFIQISRFAMGGLASISLASVLMNLFGIANSYFDQSIKYSFLMHNQDRDLRGLINVKILIYGVLFYLIFFCIKKFSLQVSKVNAFLISFTCSLIVLLIAVFQFRKLNEPFFSAGSDLIKNLQLIMKWLTYSPMFAVFFFVFIELAKSIFHRGQNLSNSKLVFLLSTTELIRLYPSPEPGHMWFMFPVLCVGLFSIKRIGESIMRFRIPISGVALAAVVSSFCILLNYVSFQRVDFQSNFLNGMKSNVSSVRAIDATIREIRIKGISGQIDFRCLLGIYSVASGKYMSIDFHYANLPHDIFERPRSKQIFVCGDLTSAEFQIPSKAKELFNLPGYFPNTRNILYEIPSE